MMPPKLIVAKGTEDDRKDRRAHPFQRRLGMKSVTRIEVSRKTGRS